MDRREFIKMLLAGAAGLSALNVAGKFKTGLDALADFAPDLVVAKGSRAESVVEEAVNAFGGMKRFIARGDRVLIKPNIAWDRAPQFAATTNPALVGMLVRLCLEAGAKEVFVFDRTCNDPRRCYVTTEIGKASQDAGARLVYIDESKVKECPINGNVLKNWPVLTDVLETDKIINVPIAKVHGLSKLTLGMKNWFGAIGGNRSRLHQRTEYTIPEIASLFKPTLVVLDAIRILTQNGPLGGDESYVERRNTVVVGQDQVAVDAYGTTLFGLKPQDMGFIVNANKMGLGEMDLSKLTIKTLEVA
ncbi:MAG: DUF362 domain-containing protein [Candidatus Omnitrophota bacterium]